MKKALGIIALTMVSLFMTTACGSAPTGQHQPADPERNVHSPGFQPGLERRPVLGILPFVGGPAGDGDTIATLFSMELEILRTFTVVPRTAALNALFAEHEFQLAGLTDSDTIAGIGRMLNAEYVLSGNIRRLGNTNIIIATVINVETLEQVAGYYRMFQNIEEIRGFLPSMSRTMVAAALDRSTDGLPRLAVMPFARDPNVWVSAHESDTLAQMLAIEILNTGRYVVLPRTTTILNALDERDFQMLGYTDDEGLASLSAALNAELVLSGATQRLGAMNMFTAQILRLRDGSVAYSAPARDFRRIDDAMHLMEEIAVFLIDPDRGHALAAARIAREADAALQAAEDAEARRARAAAAAAARREREEAEARRIQRETARMARWTSGSRNALEFLSAYYFWESGEGVEEPRSGISVGLLLSGLYFSPVPYIAFGLEARMHVLLDDYLNWYWSAFGNSNFFFSGAPTLGLVLPLGHNARVFSNVLLELGNFGAVGLYGSITDWATPGFNIGLEFGRQFGFSMKYRHTWFQESHTHAIGIGINSRF